MGLERHLGVISFSIVLFGIFIIVLIIGSFNNAEEIETLAKLACEAQGSEYFAMHKALSSGNTSQVLCSSGENLTLVEFHHRKMVLCDNDRFG